MTTSPKVDLHAIREIGMQNQELVVITMILQHLVLYLEVLVIVMPRKKPELHGMAL